MVAYSYKPRFVGRIKDGSKPQTCRGDRKRHARPGETMQLYTGMRTRQCRLIGTATCKSVEPIRFDFEAQTIQIGAEPPIEDLPDLNAFAVLDGFEDYRDLCEFWRANHKGVERWEGVLITWSNFQLPEAFHG